MERNETLLAENGPRRIFRFEQKDPEGIWITVYRGREMMHTGTGEEIEAPSDPLFASEESAREWLASAARPG